MDNLLSIMIHNDIISRIENVFKKNVIKQEKNEKRKKLIK